MATLYYVLSKTKPSRRHLNALSSSEQNSCDLAFFAYRSFVRQNISPTANLYFDPLLL